MSRNGTSNQVTEALADSLISEYGRTRGQDRESRSWGQVVGMYDPGLAAAYDVEVASLLSSSPALKRAVVKATRVSGNGRERAAARSELMRQLEEELRQAGGHARLSLEAMLNARGRGSRHRAQDPRSSGSSRVVVPVVLLNLIIAAMVALVGGAAYFFDSPRLAGSALAVALSAVAIWTLSFMPGWLFVRFLERRAGALWDEYVIHLHRLGLDDPGRLPEPPRTSAYHDDWVEDGGLWRAWMRSIYREKFDAYYGRSVSGFGIDIDKPVKSEALFPVFLCTGLLAVGWTAILYDARAFAVPGKSPGAVLSFAFIGAYLYFLHSLLRRYFQADLRAGAYVSGYVRVVTALLIAVVLTAASPDPIPAEAAVAIAFVVGWFPDVGLRALFRIASRAVRGPVPSVEPAYALNRLDGLNLWYETRLLEEGIEDLQTLVTTKFVDVLLHTKVPVARLVDWVDQALLLIHLPAEPLVADQEGLLPGQRARKAVDAAEGHPRLVLRRCGIRTATGLLRALHSSRNSVAREALLRHLADKGVSRGEVLSLHDVLAADRRLAVVFNWQGGDVEPRRPLPLRPVV